MYIGDIYLPILSNIDKKSVSKITKEIAGINAKEPRTVSIRRNLNLLLLRVIFTMMVKRMMRNTQKM